ncbi:MAG: hypothetical protein K0Q89_2865 [Thermomicrobiales bacterium]|nr:hypothetical protein [Thermomicrobiales bacterium]
MSCRPVVSKVSAAATSAALLAISSDMPGNTVTIGVAIKAIPLARPRSTTIHQDWLVASGSR